MPPRARAALALQALQTTRMTVILLFVRLGLETVEDGEREIRLCWLWLTNLGGGVDGEKTGKLSGAREMMLMVVGY